MKNMKRYAALIIMTIITFTAASLFFAFVLKEFAPVPVFIFFCTVQCTGFVLFALLPEKFRTIPRHASKIIIGMMLLVIAGVLGRQNFQIEGFVYLLFAGFVGGPVIHFGMKIIGSLVTGRSWCSWGCWTAAVLDFLPYNRNTKWKRGSLKYLRYVHLALSIGIVSVTYFVLRHVMQSTNPDQTINWQESASAVYWVVAGNGFYYLSGIILAFVMKDNRAFCKYLCPVAVLLKAGSIFALTRVDSIKTKCSGCKKCESVCPASIKVHSYTESGRRVASTECLICLNCIAVCPDKNLYLSVGFEPAVKEKLNIG
jgi:polyferredoxin